MPSPDLSTETAVPPLRFVLASRSPRRVAYLRDAGYVFEVLPADVPEIPAPGEAAADYALRVALAKAHVARAARPALPAMGADTDVVVAGRILGKPASDEEAVEMLMALSGRTHEVLSAVVLLDDRRVLTASTRTEIDFVPLTREAARRYVAGGEPGGKAGAYGIQGSAARFVRSVRGSYTGVVGLPMAETCELLARFGIEPAAHPQ